MELYPSGGPVEVQGGAGRSRTSRPQPLRIPAITRPLLSWLSERPPLARRTSPGPLASPQTVAVHNEAVVPGDSISDL